MRRYERYGHIGRSELNMVRENMGHDRADREVFRHVADCENGEDAAKIADALEQAALIDKLRAAYAKIVINIDEGRRAGYVCGVVTNDGQRYETTLLDCLRQAVETMEG